MPEGTLQGGLHFHVTEFGDGGIQVGDGFGLFLWVMFKEQFGQLQPAEGQLRPEAHLGADPDGFLVVVPGLFLPAQQGRRLT
jgi:hypothetical protein